MALKGSDEMPHIKVAAWSASRGINTSLHGREESSYSACCSQSQLQCYTKTLAFIWLISHRFEKHCSGSQEVSMFLAAHWL